MKLPHIINRQHSLLAIFLFALIFLCGCVPSFMATKLLKTALQPTNTSKDTTVAWKNEIKEYPYIGTWRDSLTKVSALRDTFITASDYANLHALFIKSAHHSKMCNANRRRSVSVYYNCGYNVILPDLRLSGLSDGDHYTMGWDERKDIKLWIDLAKKIFSDSTQIVIHGVSMGAATTMMLAGDTLPQNVKWFVEDCGYTSVWEQFQYVLEI